MVVFRNTSVLIRSSKPSNKHLSFLGSLLGSLLRGSGGAGGSGGLVLVGSFGDQDRVNVGENTALGNCYATEQSSSLRTAS
jgi:hypothetical protein